MWPLLFYTTLPKNITFSWHPFALEIVRDLFLLTNLPDIRGVKEGFWGSVKAGRCKEAKCNKQTRLTSCNRAAVSILRSVWQASRWYLMKQKWPRGTWMHGSSPHPHPPPFSTDTCGCSLFFFFLLKMLHFSTTSLYSHSAPKILQISRSEAAILVVQPACSVPRCWASRMSAAHMSITHSWTWHRNNHFDTRKNVWNDVHTFFRLCIFWQ